MELKYVNEHITCTNYAKSNEALFEREVLKKGETFNKHTEEAVIIFILKGSMIFADSGRSGLLKSKDIVLIPPVHNLSITATDDIEIIIFKIISPIHLCNILPLEKLLGEDTNHAEYSVGLKANDRLMDFLNLFSKCLEDGLRCKCFAEIKSKEVFFYFRAYYTKESLRVFFAPLFTRDYEFSVFILQNYRRMKTVQQFADALGYSLSRFERQFKKIFKISAYQWMTKQKSKLIYNDLVNTNRTIIDIADEYEFSSLSQFCDFCKRVLGTSPAKIRSLGKCKNNFPELVNK